MIKRYSKSVWGKLIGNDYGLWGGDVIDICDDLRILRHVLVSAGLRLNDLIYISCAWFGAGWIYWTAKMDSTPGCRSMLYPSTTCGWTLMLLG